MSPHHIEVDDIPKWVEVNDLLATGAAETIVLNGSGENHFAVLDPLEETLFVFGTITRQSIDWLNYHSNRFSKIIMEEDQKPGILAPFMNWTVKSLGVFTNDSSKLEPISQPHRVGLVDHEMIAGAGLDDELKTELLSSLARSPVFATFIDERPVSFCYAASQSARFWDVSVDTLVEFRRRGCAQQCVLHAMNYMALQGKQVVWQAFEDNVPSWNLAGRVGLIQTARLLYLEKLQLIR